MAPAVSAAINNQCYICFDEDQSKEIVTCPKLGAVPEHWAHKDCQTKWAVTQRNQGVQEIRCHYSGHACQTRLEKYLPPKSLVERAADFFRTRPVVQILTLGVPLLAINAAFGASVATFIALGFLIISCGLGSDLGGISYMQFVEGSLFPEAISKANRLPKVASIAFFVFCNSELLVKKIAAIRHSERDYLTAGAVNAGLIGAFVLVNGGGLIAAAGLSAFSAASTFWWARRVS